MRWVRWFVVPVIVLAVVVPWRVPVARAETVYERSVAPGYAWLYTSGSNTWLMMGTSNAAPTGYPMTFAEREPYVTGSTELVFNGVTSGNGEALMFSNPVSTGNYGFQALVSNLAGFGDDTVDTWTFTADITWSQPGFDGVHYNYVCSGSGVVKSGFTLAPLSVDISGASSVRLGQGYTYTAVMTGGLAPYSVVFQRVSTAHPADDYTYAAQVVSGTTASQVIEFPRVDSAYEVGVTVTDSLGAVASDSMVVNAASEKPVVYAGIKWTNNGQDDLLEFRVSTSAFGGVWKSDAESLPTEGGAGTMWYTVLTPAPYLRASRYFVLRGGNPPANPYTVMISLVDEAGTDWTYVFSFDTSTMSGPGDWVDTTGGGGSESTLPSWLESLIAALRNMLLRVWEVVKTALVDMFKWLFVPTDDQMASLLPSGTMGEALLEGLPEYTGADTSSYTLMGHWKVDGQVVDVPLMTLDLESLQDSGFVTAVRLCVQAGMCIALVMMMVVLI